MERINKEDVLDRIQKEKQVDQITETFNKAKSVIFTNYRGLNVAEITDLRRKLHEAKSTFKVIKNRLAKRAASRLDVKGLDPFLIGPTAMAACDVDPVLPAKVLVAFAAEHAVMQIKAGYMSGGVLDVAKINQLAKLPSRDVLYSMLLRTMNAPATNFTMTLAAIPRQLVTVIDAIRKKKEQ